MAFARQHGKPVAFVTFMTTERQTEATLGLMRQLPDAPPYATEYLITQLALELKARKFEMFSLGMAPLAGLVRTPLSSRWNRMAGLVWERGGPIYNFQGLRSFKNKFRPRWEPRYLAASGAIGPFITLADVATLASGVDPDDPRARITSDRGMGECQCVSSSCVLSCACAACIRQSKAAAMGKVKIDRAAAGKPAALVIFFSDRKGIHARR